MGLGTYNIMNHMEAENSLVPFPAVDPRTCSEHSTHGTPVTLCLVEYD